MVIRLQVAEIILDKQTKRQTNTQRSYMICVDIPNDVFSFPYAGYNYAAVQAGVECMCGSEYGGYTKHGYASGCDTPCPEGIGFCGGSFRNAVFKATGVPSTGVRGESID